MELEKIRAIIVDDEERARNTLQLLLKNYCPEVEVLANVSNVPEAVLAINKLRPDLVFLDIEMPEYNGFELIGFFREIDFEIIFVTAYSEYAIKAFEVSAVDYLLKPVDIEQLENAVKKVKQRRKFNNMQERLDLMKENYGRDDIRKIALPKSDGLLFVDVSEIIMIEADGAYSNVFLKDNSKILVSKKLRFFEDILSNRKYFFRSHRSFIVNLNYIEKYSRNEGILALCNAKKIQVARERKSEFESLLKELGLS
jgi:two-component system, LytTR family, response regulator